MQIGSIAIQKEYKTKLVAERLSDICQEGDLIALTGELGSGKTTFAKYFIRNISNTQQIPSPTYNLILSYDSYKSTIYHMDAWRLNSNEEAIALGITEMFDSSIFIIEWANKIKNILPANYLNLAIKNHNNKKILFFEGNYCWKNRLKKLLLNEN